MSGQSLHNHCRGGRRSGIAVRQKIPYALANTIVLTGGSPVVTPQGLETILWDLMMHRDRPGSLHPSFDAGKPLADRYEGDPAPLVPLSANGSGTKSPGLQSVFGRGNDPADEVIIMLVGVCPPKVWKIASLGSYAGFEAFIAHVRSLGGYPALEALMDAYLLGERQETPPLVEECERILQCRDIEPKARAVAERVFSVVRDVLLEGTAVEVFRERGLL